MSEFIQETNDDRMKRYLAGVKDESKSNLIKNMYELLKNSYNFKIIELFPIINNPINIQFCFIQGEQEIQINIYEDSYGWVLIIWGEIEFYDQLFTLFDLSNMELFVKIYPVFTKKIRIKYLCPHVCTKNIFMTLKIDGLLFHLRKNINSSSLKIIKHFNEQHKMPCDLIKILFKLLGEQDVILITEYN